MIVSKFDFFYDRKFYILFFILIEIVGYLIVDNFNNTQINFNLESLFNKIVLLTIVYPVIGTFCFYIIFLFTFISIRLINKLIKKNSLINYITKI